jgi:hypothetical protein
MTTVTTRSYLYNTPYKRLSKKQQSRLTLQKATKAAEGRYILPDFLLKKKNNSYITLFGFASSVSLCENIKFQYS